MSRLTISQVTIASSGTVPLKPPLVALNPGSGWPIGVSGVRYEQVVAAGSLT